MFFAHIAAFCVQMKFIFCVYQDMALALGVLLIHARNRFSSPFFSVSEGCRSVGQAFWQLLGKSNDVHVAVGVILLSISHQSCCCGCIIFLKFHQNWSRFDRYRENVPICPCPE